MIIIDTHTHVGFRPNESDTPEELMQELKDVGIHGALFCPLSATAAHDEEELKRGNQEALDLYERHPDFLYPGVAFHPEYPAASRYFLDAFCERHLTWVGEILSYHCKVPFDDPKWTELFKLCNERHMIVQMHNAPDVVAVAKAFPEMTIVGSHLHPEVLPHLVELPNVVIDISGFHGGLCRNTLPKARAMFGTQRLLFGTDFPGYDPAPFILRTKRDFPESEQPLLYSENIFKLLRQHGVKTAFGLNLNQD